MFSPFVFFYGYKLGFIWHNSNDKYQNLYEIASSLSALHKCNLVHGDLHSGNILFYEHNICYISDFGLSRPAYQSINSDDSNESYGVLPYIAPEVLHGELYTKAADIWSKILIRRSNF